MAFTTFISYSTCDIRLASQTKNLLEQSGSRVFLAESSLEPGSTLSVTIIDAIKSCDLFILLWSKNSQASEWVSQEIGIAKGTDKPILPISLERGANMPGFIKDIKYLEYYKDPGAALSWLGQNVFRRAKKKEQSEGIVWLGIGVAIVWLLGQSDND